MTRRYLPMQAWVPLVLGTALLRGVAVLGAQTPAPTPVRPAPARPDTARLLTLGEAVREALENNQVIGVARYDAAIAENEHSLGNAGLLPDLNLVARQNRRPGGTGGSFGGQTADVTSTASFTVFDGMRSLHTYRRLGVLERQAEIAAERTTEDELTDVAILYYDIAGQQQRIAALREAIATSEERLRIAEFRLEIGSASQLVVNQARVDLNADRAALLRQETALAAAKAALNQAIGRERGLEYRVSDTIPIDPSLGLDALTSAALEQNRDLRVARTAQEASAIERREARSLWLPTVDLVVGYAFSELPNTLGFTPGQPEGWTYGFTVNLPVFDGLNRERRIENARLREQSRRLQVDLAQTRVMSSLESADRSYRNGLALVRLEEENVALARENVAVALERFRQGLSTSVELREVQEALTAAQTRLVTARIEAKRAELTLLQLSGELLGRVGG